MESAKEDHTEPSLFTMTITNASVKGKPRGVTNRLEQGDIMVWGA